MKRVETTPRRTAVGLLAGALVGAFLLSGFFARAEREAAAELFERQAMVPLRAMADVIERLGGGEPARAALAVWSAETPQLTAVRWVAGDARTLEFSSVAGDRQAGDPPRRLVRDEKPLFDLAQRLRTTVETNREEQRAREEEVDVARLADRRLALAVPVEREGAVVGMLQAETAAPVPRELPTASRLIATVALPALGGGVLILLLAGPLAARFGEAGRWALALAATALLLAALGLATRRANSGLAAGALAADRAVGATVARLAASAESTLATAGVVPARPLAAATWDADVHRRPLGRIDDRGELAADGARLRAERQSARGVRAAVVAAAPALALFAFFALGWAAATGRALVRFRVAYAYALPALVGMLILVFFPFFYGIALSFTNSNIYNSDKSLAEIWTGFENYREILGDLSVSEPGDDGRVYDYRNFYWTFGFNVFWTVTNVAIGVSLGLLLALVLNTKGLRGKAVYRMVFILPWAVPNYITALIWKGMFHQQFGVINQVVQMFGGTPVSWFERPLTAYATVLATNGWLSFPFMMVISLGALQSISADLYEAARVDGASRWQQFRSITLPSLKPALVPAIILSVIWTFNQFNIIYLVSQGEPGGATEILITQAYKIAFEQYRYGYAAAYSTVIFVILLAYGTWQNRVTRASEGI